MLLVSTTLSPVICARPPLVAVEVSKVEVLKVIVTVADAELKIAPPVDDADDVVTVVPCIFIVTDEPRIYTTPPLPPAEAVVIDVVEEVVKD